MSTKATIRGTVNSPITSGPKTRGHDEQLQGAGERLDGAAQAASPAASGLPCQYSNNCPQSAQKPDEKTAPKNGGSPLVYATYPDRNLLEPTVWSGPNALVISRSQAPNLPGFTIAGKGAENDEENEAENGSVETAQKGGKRGVIVGISGKSRLSLGWLLSSLNWTFHGECLHVTLTYHKTWPEDRAALDRAKMAIQQAFLRLGLCGVWRLEYQKRGAPHFHLLLWVGSSRWASRVDELTDQIASWWKSYSGNGHRYGMQVSGGSEGRAAWYLAMHATKDAQAPKIAVGRWWGYVNRAQLMLARAVERQPEPLNDRELVWAARLFRRATGCRSRHGQGFRWFLSSKGQERALRWIRDRQGREVPFVQPIKPTPGIRTLLPAGGWGEVHPS